MADGAVELMWRFVRVGSFARSLADRGLERALEHLPILLERLPPRSRQAQERLWHFAAKRLFNVDIALLLKARDMARESAFIHSGLMLQIQKICSFDRIEERHNHQPTRFVDDAINLRDGLNLRLH